MENGSTYSFTHNFFSWLRCDQTNCINVHTTCSRRLQCACVCVFYLSVYYSDVMEFLFRFEQLVVEKTSFFFPLERCVFPVMNHANLKESRPFFCPPIILHNARLISVPTDRGSLDRCVFCHQRCRRRRRQFSIAQLLRQ